MVLLITPGGGSAVLFTGSDLNDAEPGVYYVHYTSSIKNIATQADGYLICLQFREGTNNKIQYYCCTNVSSINLMTFTRCQRSSGSWTDWDQVATDIGIQNNFIRQTPVYEHVYHITASYSKDSTATTILEGWLRFISTDSPGSPNLETKLIQNLESGMPIQGSCISTKNNYLYEYWNLHRIVQQYIGKFVITGVCMSPVSNSTNWYCYSSSRTLSFTFTDTKFTWLSSTQVGVEF